jgi:hypothetical protein
MWKKKLFAILGVLFGAPICAEFLQAYLSATGDEDSPYSVRALECL